METESRKDRRKLHKKLKTLLVVCILLGIWYAASHSGYWSTYVLPEPERVAESLWKMLRTGELARHVGVSLQRVGIGFGISFLLAFLIGSISYHFPMLEEYYGGCLEFMRNVPPISLIALLILWFGIGETSKIIIIVLGSFFPMYLNIRKGFVASSRSLIEVGEVFCLSRWEIFYQIVLPAAVPDILVGMRIGLGYSFRAIIGAEMIAAASGMGYLILDAQRMSRSDKVIAGIFVIGVVGMICDKLFGIIVSVIGRKSGYFIKIQ